jgi:hypothetical protein
MTGRTGVAILKEGFPPGVDPVGRQPISESWPKSTFLELGALPGASGCAVMHTRVVSAEWGLAGLTDAAARAAAELVASAVVVSGRLPGQPPVWLWLRTDGKRLLVAVGDASPEPPSAPDARDSLLAGNVTEQRGWHEYQGGKACWSVLSPSADEGAAWQRAAVVEACRIPSSPQHVMAGDPGGGPWR